MNKKPVGATTKLMPVAEMRKLFAGATPGPWEAGRNDMLSYDGDGFGPYKQVYAPSLIAGADLVTKKPIDLVVARGETEKCINNAEFIAAARTQWPLAVEWMERARALLSRIYLLDVSCHEAATSIESLLEELPE